MIKQKKDKMKRKNTKEQKSKQKKIKKKKILKSEKKANIFQCRWIVNQAMCCSLLTITFFEDLVKTQQCQQRIVHIGYPENFSQISPTMKVLDFIQLSHRPFVSSYCIENKDEKFSNSSIYDAIFIAGEEINRSNAYPNRQCD